MRTTFHSTYQATESGSRLAIFGTGILLLVALCGVVFGSPAMVLGALAGTIIFFITMVRPLWTLAGLMLYLPLEPFLLKWVPDELYFLARYGSELIVYILVFAVLFAMIMGNIRLRRSPIDVPFVLLLVAIVASVVVNFLDPFEAILGARQILRFILLFFVAYYLAPDKAWLKYVLGGLMVIIALQTVLGFSQVMIGERLDSFLLPSERKTFGEIQLTPGTEQFWDPGQRVFGTMGRYDQLGAFLGFFLLIIIAFLYEKKSLSPDRRLWIALLFLAALPVLALTYSRSAWFGFLLGFLFIGIAMKRDKRVIAFAVAVPILLAAYLSVTGLVVNRLIDTPSQSITERFFEAFSYERWRGEYYGLGRLYWIVQTVTVVVPAAPIFGHGPAMYGGGAVTALGNTDVYDELGLPFGVFGTNGFIDNNWFSLWGELGTLGLGAYLWMYITLFVACIHVYYTAKDPELKAVALGLSGAIVAVALNAFLATFLEVRTLAPYLWTMSGAVLAWADRERVL